MVSKLYAASLMSEALPVGEESVPENTQKVKKPRTKNAKKFTAPTIACETPAPRPPQPDATPVKKPRSEKQIAAAAKMVEARRLKKEQQQAEIDAVINEKAALEQQLAEKEAARTAKKVAAKAKRLQAKTASTIADSGSETPAVQAPKLSKKRKAVADEHPSWMPYIISEVHKAVGSTKSKNQLHDDANTTAAEKWKDPLVRSRVNDTMQKAGCKMYNSIFPGRQLQ